MADEIITPCNAAWAWHWIRQMAAPCNVAGGSGMICYMEFAQTSAVLEFYIWFRFWPYHRIEVSCCTSLRNFIQIGPPSAEKMMSCQFSRWRISAILDFMGLIMGSLKIPCTTSYRLRLDTMALNCLVFEKIAFLHVDKKISAILDFMGPIMGSLKSPCTTSYM